MPLPDDFGVLESQLVQHGFVKRPLTDRDIATGAGIQSSKITGLYTGRTTYRKTTAKAVNTSVAATDLLNGEITVAANAIGATGFLRLSAFGDLKNNSGASTNNSRFALVFGGTTLFDTGAAAFGWTNSATRVPWWFDATVTNTATNAQVAAFKLSVAGLAPGGAGATALTTGEGNVYQTATVSGFMTFNAQGYNTSAVDTTSAVAIVLNVTNPSASASYETKLTSAFVEII